MAYRSEHDARFATYFPGFTLEHYRQMCTPVDMQSTISAYGELNVEIEVRFLTGALFARLRHEFKLGGVVEIHWNFVEKEYRGGGYSRLLLGRILEFYKAHGFKEVVLEAARPFGLFVWALHGFDFSNDQDRDATRARVLRAMETWGSPESQVEEAQALYHSWEMATFTATLRNGKALHFARSTELEREGFRRVALDVGEHVMLKGPSWRGIMRLDDTDPTWIQHQKFLGLLGR